MKYRLYIDESGTHHYSTSNLVKHRYLSLTGVIISAEDYQHNIMPLLSEIKQIFTDDLDNLPILHREDIQNKEGIFRKLEQPDLKKKFDELLLNLLTTGKYIICTIVIDKKDHLNRYNESASHPYHYCLTVLLEKYTSFLKTRGIGDVMAEARGGVEDMALKKAYSYFYQNGTEFRSKEFIQTYLTSKDIKIKPKEMGIDGLQLADILSLPTKLYTLWAYGRQKNLSKNFNYKIIKSIQKKYYRSDFNNKVKGYGIKLL